MPSFSFQCPGCQTSLKSAGPVEPGKRIKCPKCATVFELAAAPPAGAAIQDREPAAPPARERRRRDDDDFEDEPPRRGRSRNEVDDDDNEEDRPRPRRKKRRKKAASPAMVLWLVLGGVGLLVLVGGGLTLVWLLGGFTQARLVGHWTLDHPIAKDAISFDFRADGTFTQTVKWVGNIQVSGTYSVSGNTLTLRTNNVINANMNMNFPEGQQQLQIESVDATQLVLTGPGQFGMQQRMVLKRTP